MVLVNGKTEFTVYELDTLQTIIVRLAGSMDSLPKYMYFPDGIPTLDDFKNNKPVNVINLFDMIANSNTLIFSNFYDKIKDKLSQQKLDITDDIILPFIAFNRELINTKDKSFLDSFLLVMQGDIDKRNVTKEKLDVHKIWKESLDIRERIKNKIKENNNEALRLKKNYKDFQSIGNLIQYTPFELERVTFEFNIVTNNLSLMELFNHIRLTPGVPFACVRNMYKILKDFIPSEEWNVSLENAIIFKVLQKTDSIGSKITDYSDAIVTMSGDVGEEIITVGMNLYIHGQYLNREELIDRFMETIKSVHNISIQNIVENRVNGVFYFPNSKLNKYVFSDLIMNDEFFWTLMSVDESEKASKKKESVYIHFFHPSTGSVTANITEKIAEKGDPSLRGKDVKGDFKFGSYYIRIKISSADNLSSVEKFQQLFSRLMVKYYKEYQNIVDIYRYYIPDFATTTEPREIQQNKLKLRDIAPEVFVHGYPPKCPHQPTVIGDDEVEAAQSAGKIVMRYPKSPDEGFIQRNYVCNHKKAIYPGLRDNPLENRNTVPYLPCCYTKDHTERKGTIFRHYYNEEELRQKTETGQQDLITTNKFVPQNKYGVLPDDMIKIFDIFSHDENYMYVRKGMIDSKSSFLNCVMEGMYEETKILDITNKDELENELANVREKLARKDYAASCRQEMYDFTINEIIEIIKNSNTYLDPKMFISLFESFFDCNIYVFSRIGNNKSRLMIPRHQQAYYKTSKNAKCVFIYEHTGSTSDHATYPRCELIVRWKVGGEKEEDVSYNLPEDSDVAVGIRKIFNQMKQSYALNTKIPETIFPIKNSKIKIIGQGFDSYGKTRMLRFSFENIKGTLLVSPIQPLIVQEIKSGSVIKIPIKIALNIINILKIKVTHQIILDDFVKEIQGVLGNVKVSIPVQDSSPVENIPILYSGVNYSEYDVSYIKNHNIYKKLARYVTEYMYWLFSKYLNANNIKNVSDDIIEDFCYKNIQIIPDFEYEHVSNSFDMQSGLMYNGKLVVKSEETLKRLVYVLRLYLVRNHEKIIKYHTRSVIEHYYVDITDFDSYQFQVLLQGNNSVEKWIDEHKRKYNLYKSVQEGNRLPYFFHNNLIGTDIYLAQNTNSIYKAIKIAEIWTQYGYNPGENPENVEEEMVQMTLYRYINEKDIKAYNIGGKITNIDIRILGYKIEEKSFFTVLLGI